MRLRKINLFDSIVILTIIISFVLFVLYPFIAVFNYGIKGDLIQSFLSNKQYYNKLFINSLKVALGTTVLTTIFSIFISIFYFISSGRIKKILVFIFMIAIISPPFVTSLSYINLFGRRGLITYNLLKLNYDPYGYWGIISMQSVTHIAINALLLIGFISSIDRSVINSARSLGANTNRIILDIILPLFRPAIKVVLLLTFIRSMATESRGLVSVSLNMRKSGVIYYISAIASTLILFALVSLYGAIILSAFSTMEYGKLVLTLQNFSDASEYISGVFIRSIIYALIAGGLSSVIGHVLQYYINIRKIKSLKIIDFVATLPYILPGTFFGLGYVLAFNSTPLKLTGTAAIVVLNLIFKQMPFASKIGYSSVSQVSTSQLKSVRDLGGSRMNEIKDVVFPLSKRGLYVSFVNGFTATMTTIGSIIFLVYPSQKVATLVMFDVIESGKYDIGSVIAFYIIVICLLVNVVYYLVINRKR